MGKILSVIIAIIVTLSIASNTTDATIKTQSSGVSGTEARLKKVKTWACQLQGLEKKGAVDNLVASKYGMLVVEPTRTEKGLKGFDTKGMVSRIKKSGKIVLAYVNIAEAENWRHYWTWSMTNRKTWPGYIISGDPDGWVGDYPVAFWKAAWQKLLFAKIIDETLTDGFDGIYMDWVGAFDEDIVTARAKVDKVNAHKEMVKLLGKIRTYTRAKHKDFLIIQQNAVELHKGYEYVKGYVDGISEEAVWFDGTSFDNWADKKGMDIKTPIADTKNYIQNLKVYQKAGKRVFVLEYAVKYKKTALKLAAANGFVGFCSRRALSRLP